MLLILLLLSFIQVSYLEIAKADLLPSKSDAKPASSRVARKKIYWLLGALPRDNKVLDFETSVFVRELANKFGLEFVLVPDASTDDVVRATRDPLAQTIIWSSHVDTGTMQLIDSKYEVLPLDIFRGSRIELLIMSSCYGSSTVCRYKMPPGANVIYWDGTTDSRELRSYLRSSRFTTELQNLSLKNGSATPSCGVTFTSVP